MKKYLTNKQAHDEVINGPYINKNFKTAEEIEAIVKEKMIANFKQLSKSQTNYDLYQII